MTVDLDDGGVDHGVFHVRLVRTGLEKPNENIGFHPITVAFEDGVPVPEISWQVTPWTSRPRNPKKRLDEPAIISPATPGIARLTQTVRFHLRPLGVRQHKSFHPKLESQLAFNGNPESQQALGRQYSDTRVFPQVVREATMAAATSALCKDHWANSLRLSRLERGTGASLFERALSRTDPHTAGFIRKAMNHFEVRAAHNAGRWLVLRKATLWLWICPWTATNF
jgi:hypothetical protein